MHPELLSLPFLNISLNSYGLMMVLGFMCALFLARRLSLKLGENPEHITNFGVYALLAGAVGARVFHVLHNWSHYRDNPLEVFAIWNGGLEFLGGFLAAMVVMVVFFRRKKLSICKYLDILAPALMLGLCFGRIGCFLSGCCFGAPCELPWAVRFPALVMRQNTPHYSTPYYYQLIPDLQRRTDGRCLLELSDEYYDGYIDGQGRWTGSLDYLSDEEKSGFYRYPISPSQLTLEEQEKLSAGGYPMLAIHPAQLYSSLNGFLLFLILYYVFVRRRRFTGQVFATMLVLYGITRFFLESMRNDSPLEFDGLTISQNLSIISVLLGVVFWLVCLRYSKK